MSVRYRLPRGTKASLDSLAGSSSLIIGQQYWLTDRQQVATATAVNAYSVGPKITVGTTAPSSPLVNDIWVDTN